MNEYLELFYLLYMRMYCNVCCNFFATSILCIACIYCMYIVVYSMYIFVLVKKMYECVWNIYNVNNCLKKLSQSWTNLVEQSLEIKILSNF